MEVVIRVWWFIFVMTQSASCDIENHFIREYSPQLGQFIDDVIQCKNIPGLSLAIVQDGQVVMSAGYGKRDLEHQLPVDENTVFPIGSLSKVFTAVTLANILVDLTDLEWDTPLHNRLGDSFQLPGNFRTDEVCLRDLMAHKVGLEESFLLLVMDTNMTKQEYVRRLQYFDEQYPFRSRFHYSNAMYTLAGHVAEIVTGDSYENLVRDKTLRPCSMKNSGFAAEISEDTNNFAVSYLWNSTSGKYISLPKDLFRIVGLHSPAGGLVSNAVDMAQFMLRFLNTTMDSNAKEAYKEIVSPQFALNGYSKQTRKFFPVADVETDYAMGLKNGIYRGYSRLSHSGWFAGFNSLLWFYPHKSTGIFTAINGPYTSEADGALKRIHAYATDLLMGEEPWMNSSTACSYPLPWRPTPVKSTDTKQEFVIDTEDDEKMYLLDYVGSYLHPGFGHLSIYMGEDLSLRFTYGNFGRGTLSVTPLRDVFEITIESPIWYLSAGVKIVFLRANTAEVEKVQFPVEDGEIPPVFHKTIQRSSNVANCVNSNMTNCVNFFGCLFHTLFFLLQFKCLY
ncbi:uncharacterized protein LOC100372963 [Saccoglossus kowalevskii]